MQNYNQRGDVMTFTAPAGGVVSGTGYKIGQLFVVAQADAAAGEQFAGVAVGVHDLPKNGAQAWTEGQLLYWDNGNSRVDTAAGAGANLLIGCAAADALAADAEGLVRLNGIARADG